MKDIEKIKQLREESGVSYALCTQALKEAEGDMVKARELLKKKGAEVAEKKSDRETDQGAVFTYIHHNKRIGSMVAIHCETDFVAMNTDFQKLGNDIAMHIASIAPANKEELLKSPFIKDPSTSIEQLIKNDILKIGENITLGEFTRFEI
jgi:elongation factor Ts